MSGLSSQPESTGKRRQQHPEDLTLCQLCDELLTDPRLLPCIHTLCLKCLENNGRGREPGENIPCPICEAECPVPDTGLAGLQPNAFIHQLLRIRDIMRKGTHFVCETCKVTGEKSEVKDVPATKYCIECEDKFCTNCSTFHGAAKISRSHRLLDLNNLTAHEAETIFSAISPPCSIHQDQRMTFFCKDCRLVICPHCNMMSHKTHETSELASVVEEVRHSLDHDSDRLINQTEKLCELMDSVELQKVEFLEKVLVEKAKIAEKAADLIRLVEVSKQTLLDDLESRGKDVLLQFESVSRTITDRTTSLESLKYYCGELSRTAVASVLISQSSSIHSRVEELLRVENIEKARSSLGVADVRFKESSSMQTCGNVCGEVEVKVIVKVEPVIVKKPHDVEMTDPGHVRFEATVTGEPEPSIEWFKGEIRLAQCASVSMDKNGNIHALVLKNVTSTDDGLYTIKATNCMGTAAASATLKVTALPVNLVTGMTSLNNQLFVVRYDTKQQIEVYDLPLALQQIMAVPGLFNTYGLASCANNKCLYVSNFTANCIHTVKLSGVHSNWSTTYENPTGISMNRAGNVLVAFHGTSAVVEYNTQGNVVCNINLQAAGVINPWHVIELQSKQLAVSCDGAVHVVDLSGEIVHTYNGSIPLNTPVGMALVKSGDIIVANQDSNELLVLDSSLRSSRRLYLPSGVTLKNPRALCLADRQLYVGVLGENCVVMLEPYNYPAYHNTRRNPITLKKSIDGSKSVLGVTSLNNQLFVIRTEPPATIEVYDCSSFLVLRTISLSGTQSWHGDPYGGLASCSVNNCLYVSHCDMNMVCKVGSEDSVSRWNVCEKPTGLSISIANNVLIACSGECSSGKIIIAEYTTDGSLVRTICDRSQSINSQTSRVIQVTNNRWAIITKEFIQTINFKTFEQIVLSVVDAEGNHVSSVRDAIGLAGVSDNYIVSATRAYGQLYAYNSDLSHNYALQLPEQLKTSEVLYINPSQKRLYVGESGGRLLVFDNIPDIGSGFQVYC